MSDIKVCRWPDWNRGLLASEATALPTEPQPLPNIKQLIKCTSSKQHSEGILWIRNDVKLSEHQQIQTLGCHHSSLDLSAPTILLPRVRVPSSSSTLLSFIVFVLYLLCEKNKNKQKEAEFGQEKIQTLEETFEWDTKNIFLSSNPSSQFSSRLTKFPTTTTTTKTFTTADPLLPTTASPPSKTPPTTKTFTAADPPLPTTTTTSPASKTTTATTTTAAGMSKRTTTRISTKTPNHQID